MVSKKELAVYIAGTRSSRGSRRVSATSMLSETERWAAQLPVTGPVDKDRTWRPLVPRVSVDRPEPDNNRKSGGYLFNPLYHLEPDSDANKTQV